MPPKGQPGRGRVLATLAGLEHERLTSPELADALAGVLGSDEVDVLLMLTIGSSLSDATANLRAPVVVAPSTGRAVQVILDDDALPIRTDARVLGASVKAGETVEYTLAPGRYAYMVPAAGSVDVNGIVLGKGDGAAIRDETTLRVTAATDAELVLVDTAA